MRRTVSPADCGAKAESEREETETGDERKTRNTGGGKKVWPMHSVRALLAPASEIMQKRRTTAAAQAVDGPTF